MKAALDFRRIEVIDDVMAEVYRRKSTAARLAIAHDLWRYARRRLEATVHFENPQWDDQAVGREVSRRLLNGSS